MRTEDRLWDMDIRQALHSQQLRAFHQNEHCRVIDEFVVGSEDARIDIAAINGSLHGYEIKSDADSFDRLPSQIEAYNKVFDYLYLAVGNHFVSKASQALPEWWGILHVYKKNDLIVTKSIRKPKKNPDSVPLSVANLLWKDEIVTILQSYITEVGLGKKERSLLLFQLVDTLPFDELKKEVRRALKLRQDWRSAAQHTRYADLRRSGPRSLDCRVKNLELFLSH
jgi:hypothetical protein